MVPEDPIDQSAAAPSTRRTVIKTGIKLAYVTPIVAAVIKISGSASANEAVLSPPYGTSTPEPTATPICLPTGVLCGDLNEPDCCSGLCFNGACIDPPTADD